MPIVTVQIASGRDVDIKRRLAEGITRVLVDVLDVDPEWITVLFQELERGNWATGGRLHSDRYGPGHGRQGTEQAVNDNSKQCPEEP
jgi:4-oxalocrotonate tautomerase